MPHNNNTTLDGSGYTSTYIIYLYITEIIITLSAERAYCLSTGRGVNRAKVKAKDVDDENACECIHVSCMCSRKWAKPCTKCVPRVERTAGALAVVCRTATSIGGGNPCWRCIDFYPTATAAAAAATTTTTRPVARRRRFIMHAANTTHTTFDWPPKTTFQP